MGQGSRRGAIALTLSRTRWPPAIPKALRLSPAIWTKAKRIGGLSQSMTTSGCPPSAIPLPAEQVALIKKWIEQGASYDGDDPDASLASIVPSRRHPDPPEDYPFPIPVTALEFAARDEGDELLVSGYHEVTAWNPQDGTLRRRIRNQGQRTYALSLAPDGKQLAAASGTPGELGELRLFDVETGDLTAVPIVATDAVLDAAYDPSGKQVAAGTADNKIIVWGRGGGPAQVHHRQPQRLGQRGRLERRGETHCRRQSRQDGQAVRRRHSARCSSPTTGIRPAPWASRLRLTENRFTRATPTAESTSGRSATAGSPATSPTLAATR